MGYKVEFTDMLRRAYERYKKEDSLVANVKYQTMCEVASAIFDINTDELEKHWRIKNVKSK